MNSEPIPTPEGCEPAARQPLSFQPPVKVPPEAISKRQALGYVEPKLNTFKDGVMRTNCPPTVQLALEGTAAWHLTPFDEGRTVTDRNGVEHKTLPLGRLLTAENTARLRSKLRNIGINGCTCDSETKSVVPSHRDDCSWRLSVEAMHELEQLIERSTSYAPD